MTLHGWHPAAPFAGLVLAWTAMMAAMMAPTVAPWIAAYHRLLAAAGSPARRAVRTASFAGGYLAVWSLFSVCAALVQATVTAPAAWSGAWLAGAGLFQLSPMKAACLAHCRNPLTFLLLRWNDRAAAGFSLGARHGLYCVGCCWALMLTALAMGVMNLAWMAALAAVTFVEQVLPFGQRLRVPVGIALIGGGVWLM